MDRLIYSEPTKCTRFWLQELEDFVHETMSACIEGNSEIEKLLERCEIYDQTLDKWKEKSRVSSMI